MYFCRKCGFQLQNEDGFCPQCGEERNESTEVKESVSEPGVTATEATTPKTVEESIELADKLSNKYNALTHIKEEIADCETQLKRNLNVAKAPRHSAFKFFWPFLIFASVACFIVTLIGAFIAVATNSEDTMTLSEFLGVLAAGILLIAGGNRARSKRDALNSQIADEEYKHKKYCNELEKKLEDLKRRRAGLTKAVEEYNYLVPLSARTKVKMDMVKDLLLSGRAQSFSQAIDLITVPTSNF